MKRWRVIELALLVGGICMMNCILATPASAQELLTDPGFEDPRPLEPEDPNTSDPWRRTYFSLKPMVTNATVMPNSGLEHASITQDHSIAGETNIDTAVFAGFGAASSISDFAGKQLQLSVEYKVVENSIEGSDPNAPGTFVRMYLAYFGSSGFLGFGSFASADVFVTGTNADYVIHSFVDTVPVFSEAVTVIGYNLAVPGQFGGTGTATVYFDDASLMVVPEPATASLLGMGLSAILLRRRRRRLSRNT